MQLHNNCTFSYALLNKAYVLQNRLRWYGMFDINTAVRLYIKRDKSKVVLVGIVLRLIWTGCMLFWEKYDKYDHHEIIRSDTLSSYCSYSKHEKEKRLAMLCKRHYGQARRRLCTWYSPQSSCKKIFRIHLFNWKIYWIIIGHQSKVMSWKQFSL